PTRRSSGLGGETGLARIEFGETLGDDRQVGAGHGLVELNKNVARLHPVAVVHTHLADDSAGRVLHFLDVRIDDDGALGDERAGDFGGRCPAADADREHRHKDAAGPNVPADRSAGTRRRVAVHPAPPCSGTTFNARGGVDGWITRLRTSSFSPNCCWWPLAMTRM